ncbi:MAG TPA: peptidoglycan-binding protein [Candidatus Udaeobacter sp.]|nr:peptidoglycan-binding protein [Candidatus Udaeobacter sp.]
MKIIFKKILVVFTIFFYLTPATFVLANQDSKADNAVLDGDLIAAQEAGNAKASNKDKTPPVISGVESFSVSTSSASIAWVTDEPADSDIDYGVAPGLNLHGPANSTLLTSHIIVLSGLIPNTNYSFCVISVDDSHNRARDCGHAFITNSDIPTDTNPPVITNIQLLNVSTSTVTVNWVTDEISFGQIEYGVSNSYGSVTPLSVTLDVNHSTVITDLTASTTYHLRIRARDDSGNESFSVDIPFSTLANPTEPHTTPPIISAILPHEISQTFIHVSWMTDELADSQVEYGTSTNYGFMTRLDTIPVLAHEQFPNNLMPDTAYHLRVRSHDYAGNLSVSGDYEFRTIVGTSTNPYPILSAIAVTEIRTSSVVIGWTTDKPATSRVEYGLASSYGHSTAQDDSLVTLHSQAIYNLSQHTTYHFRVISSDNLGNTSYSTDTIFETAAGEADHIPPTAIHDLTANEIDQTSLTLNWTGPEDTSGIISYDINSSLSPIIEENFFDPPVVHEAVITADDAEGHGFEHTYQISGLAPNAIIFFAIKASDPYGNISPVSNVISVKTLSASVNSSGGGTSSGSLIGSVEGGYSYNGKLFAIDKKEFVINDKQPPARVSDVRAAGIDKAVILSWKAPSDSDFKKVLVVRSESQYPANPLAGTVVYEGSRRIVSDINLLNGKTYYYSIFSADEVPNYSHPVQLSIAPIVSSKQYNFVTGEEGKINIFTNRDFGLGDRGPEVQYVQRLLSTNPLLYPEGLVTGYFGPLTRKALIRFQHKYKIPETGVVDNDVRAVAKNLTVVHVVTPIANPNIDLKFGMRAESVKIMQTGLVQLGYLSEDSVSGYFDSKTLAAVIKFQKDNNIFPAVGYVGPITRAKAAQILRVTTTSVQ